MSTLRAREDGAQENSDLSLTKAVEDISQYSHAQMDALEENQKRLKTLQTVLLDVEMKCEIAQQELRSKLREMVLVEGEIKHLELHTNALHDRFALIFKENIDLQFHISEEEERARMALAQFSSYRTKMEGHRAAVSHAANQTGVPKELKEKRALVTKLRGRIEELKQDLQTPHRDTIQTAEGEVEALKEKISVIKKLIAERKEHLHKEFETHTRIKKDIEIQNRRYEAIVKRLHCQLNRAQAVHRQMCEDVYNMERQLAELKRQQKS